MPAAVPSVAPPRTASFIFVVVALFLVCGSTAIAQVSGPVRRIGEYSNVHASADGRPHGFEVSLWRDRPGVIGLITFVDGDEHFSCTSLIRDGVLVDDTGAITLRAKLFLTERRSRRGDWGRAVESIEFTGTLSDSALSGRFAVVAVEAGEHAYFRDQNATLRRVTSTGPTVYASHADWLAAHEGLIGTHEIAVAPEETAAIAGRALQVGLSGGIFQTRGDDGRFFESGGGHFTTDVFYTVASRVAIGARMGLSRFSPNDLAVGDVVVPEAATDVRLKVPETGFLFELAPAVRISSGDPVIERTLGFVQVSAGYYYVNLETPYSLAYQEGVRTKAKNGSVGHIGHHFGASVSAGVSVRLSRSSRVEIAPEYHRTFGPSDLSLFGVMLHFRVEFLHD